MDAGGAAACLSLRFLSFLSLPFVTGSGGGGGGPLKLGLKNTAKPLAPLESSDSGSGCRTGAVDDCRGDTHTNSDTSIQYFTNKKQQMCQLQHQ